MADSVFLTGATGFVGGHVLTHLVATGYRVRALARTPASLPPGCEPVAGDLTDPGTFAHALDGCRYVVHCAALYSFKPRMRAQMERVNVAGTASLLAAAHVAGVERAVVTSSSATVGPSPDGAPVDESASAHGDDAHSSYHRSKRLQERAALAARTPVILLLPTAPIGPGDAAPTPTGRIVRDFVRGRMVARPPRGGMNLVPVEDVARAHVRALTHGRIRERYLLGGDNLMLDDIWRILGELTGSPVPRARIPDAALLAIAYADELRCRVFAHAEPVVPLEGARMANDVMFATSAKAAAELGHAPGPALDALARAVAWYRTH